MSQQNELTFLMVKLSGSDETIKQSVAAVVRMIQNQFDPTPASPSAPATLPAATQAPAALPEPDQDRGLASPVGGVDAKAVTTQKPVTRRRSKRRTPPSAPVSAAAPAQASFTSSIPASSARGGQEKLRSNAALFECQEKPGRTFTSAEAADLARIDRQRFSVRMSPSQCDPDQWRMVGAFHFKRSSVSPLPSASPAAERTGNNYESKPRACGDLAPINSHLVGGAARITHADPG